VGRVNRRFLLLALILAALSAVLVYAATSRSDGGGGGSSSGAEVPVVVAKVAIPAGTEITADMLEVTEISESLVGDAALGDTAAVIGQVARYPISANQQILVKDIAGTGAITNDALSHILEAGQRGMAINVELVVSAGGLVLPGDHVDVFWIPEDSPEDVEGGQLIAEDVEVVAVAQTLTEIAPTAPGVQEEGAPGAGTGATGSDDRTRGTVGAALPDAVTVTLMLTPEQVQRVFCADEGGPIRLAVRAFGDTSPSGLPLVSCVALGTNNQ
jgi:pilus assembly protein CpaB